MSKILVVYYSYTGHTKMIAEKIRNKINCDILELKPVKEYSKDYNVVVSEEHNNSSNTKTPDIIDIKVDLNQYDKIVIGTPVWWYSMSPVIRTFLTKYDLSSKIIIPYATNAGWLGHTFEDIKKLCQNSIIERELNIVFTENYNESKLITKENIIDEWIENI